jgi:hypothetical protein
MRIDRSQMLSRALLWFGVIGAPFAWAAQHVTGYGLSEAACSVTGQRHGVALDAWTIAVTAVAATLAVLAEAASIVVFRATRDVGDEPPGSRVHFLSVIGMTISPLFLAIILMSGLGSVFLANCQQS